MKKLTAVLLGVQLVFTGAAFAKGTFVPGAKCTACHVGKPSEEKFNEATTKMLKAHKVEECKNCHGKAEGDKGMTTKAPDKK